mmetsp:Transcript_6326/g.11228  ORF Transcript_6326/g.11228 Transcript_6326/m.11228 type:complete len:482 (+) Transcript_6326:44-1489(+)
MSRVVVLGGGVSGLTAAFLARRALGSSGKGSVCLVEQSDRLGGWFKSSFAEQGTGPLLEQGPHSFRPAGPSGPSIIRLIEELGLEKEALPTSSTAKQRYVWLKGDLHELPTSVLGMLQSPIFRTLPFVALREATIIPARTEPQDESIHDFFSRRFSPFVAEHLADAMVQGIFAGDSRQLSINACFPLLRELEVEHGSVVRGMLSRAILGSPTPSSAVLEPQTSHGKLLSKATGVSFEQGLQRLTDELARQTFYDSSESLSPECTVMTGKQVSQITKDGIVKLSDGTQLEADVVLSALPLRTLPLVLPQDAATELKALEENTKAVNVAVVNLIYENGHSLPVSGFGHLIPTNQKQGIMGMIYDSEAFPQQHNGGKRGALTVMVGGAKAPEKAQLSEDQLVSLAVEKAREHLGITQAPSHAAATVHRDCIPQYGLGHRERASQVRNALKLSMPFLKLFGNSFDGVGIADSVAHARKAVEEAKL